MSKAIDRQAVAELVSVFCKRRDDALEAGLSWDDANDYADSEAKTEDLRHLIEIGCPPELLAKILL